MKDDHRIPKKDDDFKNLAKIDTPLSRDKTILFQGSLSSAKEKHKEGDDGFEILNYSTVYSGMEGEAGLIRGEERDYRLPESEHFFCNSLSEGSVTSHLSIHSNVDPDSGKDILQSPALEEDHVNEHSDYCEPASQEIAREDIKGKEISPRSVSSHSVTNMLQACRSIHDFKRVSKISEGVYGVVFKAQDKKTGEIVAIKKVKMEREKDGFPITSLREINILLSLVDHPSIIVVKEVAVDKDFENVYIVMDHMEQDLVGLLATHKNAFSQSEVKYMMLQLLEGVEYIHNNWVLHRDLKPSNLLIDRQGTLKICDFGLARQYGSPLKTYTHKVVSLWYRDPVLLLGSGKYSTAVDMWSCGCIMAELLGKVPLFEGCSEVDQLKKIVAVLGSPDETVLQDKLSGVQFNFLREPSKSKLRERFPPMSFTGKTPLSESGFNLLSRLLMYDPNKRISAEEAVRHAWFREYPLPNPLIKPTE